jgi:Bacterial TSP3 repeat
MKRLFIVAVGLSLSLGGMQPGVLAQLTAAPVITGNVNGSCVSGDNAGDGTITCGELNPVSGMTVIGPAPGEAGPTPAPAPQAEAAVAEDPAPVEDSGEETPVDAVETETTIDAGATETAGASETDRDVDNYPDAQEIEVGLDPTTIDTDGDGVADGDEGTLYGTDPTVVDTDGDGVSDGEELFDRRTDPLVWNDFSVESTGAVPEEVAVEEGASEEGPADEVPEVAAESPSESAALAQETKEDLTATNGDAAALGTGNASSAPGTVTRNGVSGVSLLGPDGTYRVSENSPPIVNVPSGTRVEIAPPAAPEPVADTTVDETSEPVATDVPANTAATEIDTDGDGLSDDYEINVYATDPGLWDTDGDGLSDGDELLTTGSDPFVWDTDGDGVADGDEGAAETDGLAADPPTSDATGVDSDNDRLADANEAAAGTDPTTPDADGDGYYDGDEVNLGTDPLDPASFPST